MRRGNAESAGWSSWSAARSPTKSSGVDTVSSLVTLSACLRMKRAELPTPHTAAYLTSVLIVAGPGTPTWIGSVMPAARKSLRPLGNRRGLEQELRRDIAFEPVGCEIGLLSP